MQAPLKDATHTLRLGLIGGNIRQSRAPVLHRLCGQLTGVTVTYELIIPAERGVDFEAVFETCRNSGMRGVNITYPFKERAAGLVNMPDPEVALLGAINTVVFDPSGPQGYNTDFSGFRSAYRATFGEQAPGAVALVGAGGVGRAIGFALLSLGAMQIRVIDKDMAKAASLTKALKEASGAGVEVSAHETAEAGMAGADGVINATPVGMHGYPGSPVPSGLLDGKRWAFDAVYTPSDTTFVKAAEAAGLRVMSGYELFLYQGLHAFTLFAGVPAPDADTLRRELAATS